MNLRDYIEKIPPRLLDMTPEQAVRALDPTARVEKGKERFSGCDMYYVVNEDENGNEGIQVLSEGETEAEAWVNYFVHLPLGMYTGDISDLTELRKSSE